MITSCANTQKTKGKRYKINANVAVPNSTEIAVYIPQAFQDMEYWVAGSWHKPGLAMREALNKSFGQYFTSAKWFDRKSTEQARLFLDLNPDWDFEGGKVIFNTKYSLLDAAGNEIASGSYKESSGINYHQSEAGYYNAAYKAFQRLAVNILNSQQPSKEKFVNLLAMNKLDLNKLIDKEKPTSSGTGFFVNAEGDVVTANHVVDDCLIVKVKSENGLSDAHIENSSRLLDVATLRTAQATEHYVSFRKGHEIKLGEKITTVSYPLKGLLASSPNMTFGNVTSHKALSGSLGLFQFSAPIQPGSSGGAIVSDGSELLGVVTSTLNIKELAKEGVIPQNVNFALEAKYLKKFFDKYKVNYTELETPAVGNSSEKALNASAQIACYQ
ncbi:S1 family peptidase [Catenovulum sediminis]|uniref:Serine protease n=1 Tax=Catenovulum sediminis TaxID=1740262 RepID=A0ABV1RHS9_9ALTE|nr:serine protease [Catenovulum sediminis]